MRGDLWRNLLNPENVSFEVSKYALKMFWQQDSNPGFISKALKWSAGWREIEGTHRPIDIYNM